jgi:hypothetical protein
MPPTFWPGFLYRSIEECRSDEISIYPSIYKKSEKHRKEAVMMGVYSSEAKAWEAFERLENLLFSQYTINSVAINKYEMDKMSGALSFHEKRNFIK